MPVVKIAGQERGGLNDTASSDWSFSIATSISSKCEWPSACSGLLDGVAFVRNPGVDSRDFHDFALIEKRALKNNLIH